MSEGDKFLTMQQRQVASLLADEHWDDPQNQVGIVQYGPDGTTAIGTIRFYTCPVCAAMVPQDYEGYSWKDKHRDRHVEQAA